MAGDLEVVLLLFVFMVVAVVDVVEELVVAGVAELVRDLERSLASTKSNQSLTMFSGGASPSLNGQS